MAAKKPVYFRPLGQRIGAALASSPLTYAGGTPQPTTGFLPPGSLAERFSIAQQQQAARSSSPFKPFTPYQTPPLPAGSYDPALDAQLGAAQRGLGDTQADYDTQALRAGVDYGLQQDAIGLNQTRGLADYGTQRSRGQEDYSRQTQLLQRSYQQLANRQDQQIAVSQLDGGAALQAAAKRSANQAIDQQPLDTAWQRAQQDIGTGESRLRQDTSNQLGQLGLQFQRGGDDALSSLLRAQREAGQFGIDTESEKAFQAAQGGYQAPSMPKSERVDAHGNHYRVVSRGGHTFWVDPAGKVIKRVK